MKNIILILALSAVVALGTNHFMYKPSSSVISSPQDVAFERIMKTGTIRCGYALYDPLITKDPDTGKIEGVFYDLVNEMGRELDLKIDWVAEVGYGEIEEGFLANKYDVFCSGAIPIPKRAKYTFYTTPLYYQATVAWVRSGDTRFDKDLERLNAEDVTLVVRDGDVSESIAMKKFPKAKRISSPQMVDYTQMLVDVHTGKADAGFFEKSFGDKFLAKNSNAIKIARPNQPVNLSPVSMMLPMGEGKLKSVLDMTLTKLILNGSVEAFFRKNAPDYDLWSVGVPYRH
ncbi:MAG TPA: hypothetical protein DD400_00870 [Rhodospirillaceae bacterium]|nr:hypothetical protein [Rhodospirillaceae bacterium]